MTDITWHEPICGGDGGNSCIQLGFAVDGTPYLRESDRPEEIVRTTPEGLRTFVEAVKRGELDDMLR